MAKRAVLFIILLLLMLTGCAQKKIWTSRPGVQTADSQYCKIQFKPLKENNTFFVWFRLTVTNETGRGIEIDWNKTRYIYNGRNMGVFVFEGINPEDVKNLTIPPEIVPGGQTFSRDIAPFKLVAWAPIRDRSVAIGKSRITPGLIPAGENGIYLVIRQDGQEVREKIEVNIENE